MKEYLENIPQELKEVISKVRDIAVRENVEAYLVGGFVRDLILGVKNLDLDIVIKDDGIKFAADFANLTGAKITSHRQFGTATVFIGPELKIDFSSARREYYPKPGHLPVVEKSSLRDDLFRRDFTINAMAINLNDGSLVDYFGGKDDLKNKVIRVLHPLSFIDDPTRILRAVRFEQRYNFKIEPKTLRLLKEAVRMGLLKAVHPHRMRDDLILALKEEDPIKEIKRLDGLTGFDFILPGLTVTPKTYLLLKNIGKEINWFKQNCSRKRRLDTWLIYLMGLLDSSRPGEIERTSERLGLHKGQEKRLLSYKRTAKAFIPYLNKLKIKPSRIFILLEPLSYEVIIALKAKYSSRASSRNIADFFEIYNGMRISVCGEDLHSLGILPGPRYQQIFASVLEAKLNGLVKTKEEELALISKLIKNRSSSHVKTR